MTETETPECIVNLESRIVKEDVHSMNELRRRENELDVELDNIGVTSPTVGSEKKEQELYQKFSNIGTRGSTLKKITYFFTRKTPEMRINDDVTKGKQLLKRFNEEKFSLREELASKKTELRGVAEQYRTVTTNTKSTAQLIDEFETKAEQILCCIDSLENMNKGHLKELFEEFAPSVNDDKRLSSREKYDTLRFRMLEAYDNITFRKETKEDLLQELADKADFLARKYEAIEDDISQFDAEIKSLDLDFDQVREYVLANSSVPAPSVSRMVSAHALIDRSMDELKFQRNDRESYVQMIDFQRSKREVKRKRPMPTTSISPGKDSGYASRVNKEYDERSKRREERIARLDYRIRRR